MLIDGESFYLFVTNHQKPLQTHVLIDVWVDIEIKINLSSWLVTNKAEEQQQINNIGT